MDIRQEIKSANKVLGDFLKAGDAKGMASCYSTKPKLMAPNFKAFKGKKAMSLCMLVLLNPFPKIIEFTSSKISSGFG